MAQHFAEHERTAERLGAALAEHLAAHRAKVDAAPERRRALFADAADPAPTPRALRRTQSIVSDVLMPAQCERTAWLLLISSALSTFAMNLTMTPTTEIWLEHFNGDFAAHARMMTNLGLVSNVVGFFVKPIIASLSDAYGRKPLLYLSPIINSILTGGMIFVSFIHK